MIYLVFGSENLQAKVVSLRGNHPDQLCQQSIVYVFEFSKSKTTCGLWNTKFVPRLPSEEFAFFLFLFPSNLLVMASILSHTFLGMLKVDIAYIGINSAMEEIRIFLPAQDKHLLLQPMTFHKDKRSLEMRI